MTRDTRAFTPMRALLLTLASAAAWAPTATGPCVSGHTTATTDDGRVLLFGGLLADGAATDALWDAHIGMSKQDCTHFCFFPALAELWSYLVLKALDAVDSGDAAAVRAFDAWDWR